MVTKKYKKYHKIKKIFKNENNNLLSVKKGFYGLKIIESGIITPKQLETIRRIFTKITKRAGKIYINISFSQPLTKKPLLSRMGKGCGGVNSWISYIKKGKIILEILGVPKSIILKAFKAIQHRVIIKMKIIKREILDA